MSQPQRPTGNPMASMWIYTLFRIAVFAVIFGVLWALGVRGLLAALIAVVLSVPISYVVLARQRARLVNTMQDRMGQRRERMDDLEAELSGEDERRGAGPTTDGYRPKNGDRSTGPDGA